MGKLLNNLLVGMLPYLPRIFVRQFARRYVAGDSIEDAVRVCKELNAEGFKATIDILGEHIKEVAETEEPTEKYIELFQRIKVESLDANVSLKLSQLGLEIDKEVCWDNLSRILDKASEVNNFLRIDMEDSRLTSATLELFKRAREKYPRVGVVLQAYLFRSESDLKSLFNGDLNIRICKGIYKEPPEIAFQDREKIRENFLRLVHLLLENGGYAAIATHDHYLINNIEDYIRERHISSNRYEFQALLGVPIKETLKRLISEGHTVRIYVPFGTQWYAYSTRRLKENPDIAGYVIKNLFSRDF